MHRDDAGHLELASRYYRSRTGGNGPVRMDDIGTMLVGLRQDCAMLRFHVVSHHGDPGKLAQPTHPALSDPAIGKIGRQLERESHDSDTIESLPARERSMAGSHHGH
jgi:hypothetical protein